MLVSFSEATGNFVQEKEIDQVPSSACLLVGQFARQLPTGHVWMFAERRGVGGVGSKQGQIIAVHNSSLPLS